MCLHKQRVRMMFLTDNVNNQHVFILGAQSSLGTASADTRTYDLLTKCLMRIIYVSAYNLSFDRCASPFNESWNC